MANPSGFGADAAYDRAVAAFGEQSYDVARRWVLEALAQNPEHAGARSLLGRLDSVRRPPNPAATPAARRPSFGSSSQQAGPETVSIDPTVLISHASRTPAAEPIEPTVLVRRDEARRAPSPDPFKPAPPSMRDTAPVAEPTVIRRPAEPPPAARPRPAAPRGTFLQRWRDLFGGPRAAAPAPSSSRSRGMTPGMRGAALVVVAVVAAALLLALGVAAVRWMWPAGQQLTLTRPTGGTIVGPGIECGTKGNDCATTRPTGEAVELEPRADSGYVFSGFTGDCAPVGRIAMSGPRKCGARFDAVAAPPASVTFPLTINKPVGGTIAGEPNILCGTLDNVCSANIAAGTPVTMRFQADTNFTFQAFTGDCAPSGELTMNGAKTCGGIFMPTPGATVVNRDTTAPPPVIKRPPPKRTDEVTATQPASPAVQPPVQPPPVVVQQPPVPAQVQPSVAGPAKDPITEEQHAKDEITRVVTNYCLELQKLKPDGLKPFFSQLNERALREQFRDYKSLKCAITEKPEFELLTINPTGSGSAQVKVGLKQTIEMRTGGAPQVKETIVRLIMSRLDRQSAWLIDRINAEEKPK
jgi:hypothetical protein